MGTDIREMQRRNLLIAVARAASQLVRAPRWPDAAEPALAGVCSAFGADRVLLIRFDGQGRGTVEHRVVGWSVDPHSGPPPETYRSLQDLPMVGSDYDLMHHLDHLSAGDAFVVHQRPGEDDSDQWLLRRAQVLSSLRLPVFNGSALWGMVGFDCIRRRRDWRDPEILALWCLTRILGAVVERDRG